MFILAHTGITLGAAWLIARERTGASPMSQAVIKNVHPSIVRDNYAESFGGAKHVDYRLILTGSMLPDIIDKPLGLLAPELGLGTGRGIAHTLVFALLLLALGLWFYRAGRPGLLYMALASAGHLVLDRMWQMPRVLFWPLYGFAFPVVGRHGFLAQLLAWWHTLWTNPVVLAPEMLGAAILVLFAARLWLSGSWGAFLRTGTIKI